MCKHGGLQFMPVRLPAMLADMPSPAPADSVLQRAAVPRSSWRVYALAMAALLACLAILALYVTSVTDRELRERQREFVVNAEAVAAQVRQRLFHIELITRGGVALFSSVEQPSRAQWTAYADGLQIESQFPSMIGLGYAAYADSGPALRRLDASMTRAGELPLWRVVPAGERAAYGPIVFLDPATPANRIALGYDMYSEPLRRQAMQAARDTGLPTLSGVVDLVQDAGAAHRAGMLLYSPVYSDAQVPPDTAARRARLRGWVYVPFHADVFVQRVQRSFPKPMILRVVDVGPASEQTIYADPAFRTVLADGDPDAPAFTHSIPVQAYGREWRVDFQSPSRAVLSSAIPGLGTTILVGSLASLLLFLVILSLARTRAQAEAIASRMTESFRRSEQRFRNSMHYSAIGKVLLDKQGRVVESNPALSRITGMDDGQLLGLPFARLLVDDDPAGLLATGQHRALGVGVHRLTCDLRHADGTSRTVQLTFAPMPGDPASEVTSLVQVEDVSERVRAEARIHALNRSLETRVQLRTRELLLANKELESFSYTISHDLRAPLRAIDGFSQILDSRHAGQLDATGRGYLARIRAAAARMSELIDALLTISRLGRGDLHREWVDMSAVAGEIVAELHEQDPQRQVLVSITPGMQVYADRALLRNLLQNLLDNAWKFTRDADPARISLQPLVNAEVPSFALTDNGTGFDPAYANKLFRPFQRLHDQAQFEGHGIGLASVRRIVERHGGSIRAESAPGQGARFVFSLPDPPPTGEESAQASLL